MIHTRQSLTDGIRGELFPRDFGMGFSVARFLQRIVDR